MTKYNRYEKLQKYYLGVPVDPPEYKQGALITIGGWETIEDCETEDLFLWKEIKNEYICELSDTMRWYKISGEYICEGTSKYEKLKLQNKQDPNGDWVDAIPTQIKSGNLIENNSSYCGYGYHSPFDIYMYDNTLGYASIVDKNIWNIDDYPSSRYTPLGVVIIPFEHNVYGDNSCGIMSLKVMSCTTPDCGSEIFYSSSTNNTNMCWGSNVPNLEYITKRPLGNTSTGLPERYVTSSGYIPSDAFSQEQCRHNTYTNYHYKETTAPIQAPSPYLTDGSRNPGYYQIPSPYSENNAYGDFDGRGNTDKIITQRGSKDYSSWKPTYNSETDYPAASCCDMFYTEGTQQGNWYLPAAGELGYIMNNLSELNEFITIMKRVYGNVSELYNINNYCLLWSSTQFDIDNSFILSLQTGSLSESKKIPVYNRDYEGHSRAFIRINNNGDIIR